MEETVRVIKIEDLLQLKRSDLPDYVRNNLEDLVRPENRKVIWELTDEANGQFKRGDLIEEIFNQWEAKYKNYQNLNDVIPNYPTLDFDGVLGGESEVVSLKSYHPKLATDRTLKNITGKIEGYAKKLASAVLDSSHKGKKRVLDFVIKEGEWNSFMEDLNKSIYEIQNDNNITIRITQF